MNTVFTFALFGFGINLLSFGIGLVAIHRLGSQAKYLIRPVWDTLGLYILLAVNSWFILLTGHIVTIELVRP